MLSTCVSLLERLKGASPDPADWQRFHDLYTPLIQFWLVRLPCVGDEADDLTQEVFVVLLRELPSFKRQRKGSFRAWLRQITLNRLRAFRKTRGKQPLAGAGTKLDHLLAQLEDSTSDLSRQWDRDHDHHVFQKLLDLVRTDFTPITWQAFTLFALQGQPAARVAETLGLSESAVMQAKFRVLKRLREEAGELID